VNDPKSVDGLDKWSDYFNQECGIEENSLPVIVIGNKTDQKTEDSIPIIENAITWCKKRNYTHFESSALDGTNIETIFQNIADILYEKNPKIIDFVDEESSLLSQALPPDEEKRECC